MRDTGTSIGGLGPSSGGQEYAILSGLSEMSSSGTRLGAETNCTEYHYTILVSNTIPCK